MSPCDYRLYPSNWHTEIRPAILNRAGRDLEKAIEARCEFCGVKNHSYTTRAWRPQGELTRIVLTVAHLDQDVTNNDPNNLRALCQRCHLRHDRPFHLISAQYTRRATKAQRYFPFEPNLQEALRMAQQTKSHQFNVLLDPEQLQKLEALADARGRSKAQVLREAMETSWMMIVCQIPVCASGLKCFVPNMHVGGAMAIPPAANYPTIRQGQPQGPPLPTVPERPPAPTEVTHP